MTRTVASQGSSGGGRASDGVERSAEWILRSGNDHPVVEARAVLGLDGDPAAQAHSRRFADVAQALPDSFPQLRAGRNEATLPKVRGIERRDCTFVTASHG